MLRGDSYPAWLRARCTRLIRPALWFVAFWTVLPMLAVAIALPSSMARVGGEEVSLPLWFLSVYVLIVAAAPIVMVAHRRFGGARVLLVLVAATALADIAHYGLGQPWVAITNYGAVWLAVIELGLMWRDGTLTSTRWMPAALLVAGLGSLIVLTTSFDYPVSMITLSQSDRSNAFPPSLALLALGVAFTGIVLSFEGPARRWLERPKAWLAVATANSMIMTFYLWNMSALVLAAVLVLPTGIAPQPEPLSSAWWLLRPAWIAVCAVCLIPFLYGFRWAERPADASIASPGRVASAAGAIAAAAGLGILAREAFPVQGESMLLPFVGVALVAVSAWCLRIDPVAPLRTRLRT